MDRTLLRLRAVLSLVLVVLFYVLGALAAAGLVYGGVWVGGGAIAHVRGRGILLALVVAAGMVLAGLSVAWSMLPRFERFVPPGPELHPSQHPRLFREIHRVAARAGEKPPSHVYLVNEVNAFVAQRGGWLGLGSKRVMGVGLGLLNALTVSQFRAVLAHEFGHFAGGDTRLGAWLYKARGAMVRTLQSLAGFESSGTSAEFSLVFSIVKAPVRWYTLFYLRFTFALSRAQEFAADALAVKLEGAPALTSGLTRVRVAGIAWSNYLDNEVQPLVHAGGLPPVSQGFRTFLSKRDLMESLEKAVAAAQEEETDAEAFDTHPPLSARLAYARAQPGAQVQEDHRVALELLDEVPLMEQVLVRDWAGIEGALKPVSWEHSGPVLAKRLKENAVAPALKRLFDGLAVDALPQSPSAHRAMLRRVFQDADELSDEDAARALASFVYPAVYGVLLDAGFLVDNRPGEALRFFRGDQTVEPSSVVRGYLSGESSSQSWTAYWAELDLTGRRLATETASPLSGPVESGESPMFTVS